MDTGSDARHYLAQQPASIPAATSPTDPHAAIKKRRTASTSASAGASGSRGVANLTPDQLAKKRANDREAQRAIRERTKTQIDGLERRIQELTSQQPYQELQHVIRQKELVEAENDEIKRKLHSVLSILQPLAAGQPQVSGNGVIDPNLAPRQETIRPAPILTSEFNLGPQTPGYGGPRSATSTTSTYTPATLPPQRRTPPPNPQSTYTSQPNAFATMNVVERRHSSVSHLSRTSDEKLDIGYLLHSRQDSQNGRDHYGNDRPHSLHSCSTLPMHTLSPFESNDAFGMSTLAHAVPVRNLRPTCPLDGLLLDFLAERRQQAEKGMPTKDLIGPAYPSVASLLQPKRSQMSHPLSKMFTDMLSTFPDLSTLPEQVAVFYIMFLVMRWQISPTLETYNRLPDWVTPRPSQLITPHPAWVDYLPWPRMRENLVRQYPSVPFDEFFIPYTTTLSLNWPYEAGDTLLTIPGTDELSINPVFERHMMDLGIWSLGPAFARTHPGLAETCAIQSEGERRR